MNDRVGRFFEADRGEGRKTQHVFTMHANVLTERPDNTLAKKLYVYLTDVFLHGVPEGQRASVSGAPALVCKAEQIEGCDLVGFAKMSDYHGAERFQHDLYQQHVLKNDVFTVGVEVPVWSEDYLGHVDQLRLFQDKIHVCDLKPGAAHERKAASQVYRYVMLLSKTLGLPIKTFEGWFFDDQRAYKLIF
jgi:hypothetical protein